MRTAPWFSTVFVWDAFFLVLQWTQSFYIGPDCYKPLGLSDGRINDTQITANTVYNNNTKLYGPGRARLNRTGGYRAQPGSPAGAALSVYFPETMIITGIATQGYYGANIEEWTKRYNLGYSFGSGTFFFKEKNRRDTKQFLGNKDNNTIVRHFVPLPAMLTSLHVIPTWWHNNFAIRLELYGCIRDFHIFFCKYPCFLPGDIKLAQESEENRDTCQRYWKSKTRDKRTDDGNECESLPCLNNGSCWEKIRGYQCNCTAGFNGTHCEKNIDDCASNPCLNNGTCSDQVNDFSCNCTPGYTGKRCEIDVNECSSSPCQQGGTCIDHVNGFTCKCPVGFGGLRCEQELDFFLVVWLKLKNMTFTVALVNESSALYRTTEDAVLNEINNMLVTEKDYFFGSALRKFSPLDKDTVTAEILLRTLMNSTDHIMNVIKLKLKSHKGIFEKNYKFFENRANPSCSPPNISTPLSTEITKPTKMKKSEDFRFLVRVEIDCRISGQVQVSYSAEMYIIDFNSGSFRRIVYRIGTTVGDVTTTVRGKGFDYGLYYFKFTGTIERQTGTTVNSYGYIEVTSTSLIVNIIGDSQVSQGLNKNLTLNGSQSHDPDVGKGDYTGLNFTWLCRREEETFPDDIASLPVVLPPSGSPGSWDRGGCYGTGVGKLKARAGASYIVDLDVDKMKGDQDYVIKLVMTKRGQTATAVHRLRIKEEIQLSIVCLQNCQRYVILSSRLILETRCSGLLCDKIDTYTWSMKYRDKGDPTWKEITNLDEIILTYRNSPNLVTAQGRLYGNASYLVTVKGVTSTGYSSIATYSFLTNTPPFGGKCEVDKPEGKAWETSFVFTCSGWYDEDLPLKYKFRYNSSDGIEMVFQSGTSREATGKLPVGDPNEDYKLQVQVLIIDDLGSSVDTWINVKVTDPVVSVQSLKEDVSKDGPMNQYLKDNNIELAAQRATAVLSVVNHAQKKELKLQDKIKLKDSIVDAWSAVNVSSLEEVSQVSAVVASAADKRNELSIDSQEKAVIILDSMTDFMTQKLNNKSNHDDEEIVEQVGTSLLNGLGNLLDITAYEAKEDSVEDEEESLIVISSERKQKSKSYAKQILRLVNRVGTNVENTKEVYERPSVLKTRSLSMVIDRQVPSRIGDKALEDEGSKVTLPSTQELIGSDGKDRKYLSSQLVTFNTNPYTWDKGASNIKSSVLDFELKDESGYKLNVSNLVQDVELFIPLLQQPEVKELQDYFVKPSDNGTMQFHKVVFPGPEYAISIRIVPSANKNLKLYVRYAQRPTLENFTFTAFVPDYSSCNYTVKKGHTNCSTDPFMVTLSAAITGHTGLHYIGIAYEVLYNHSKINTTTPDQVKRVRRGCSRNGRQKRSCVGVKDPPTTPPPIVLIKPPYNASTDVNYTLAVTMATCQYWNESAEAWSTEGCRVGPKSRPEALQCLCNHLSSFGGNFLVAPNPIDFDYVFKQFPNIFDSGNVVVLATVLSIFGLWIIGLLIARRADRKDEYKAVENLRLQVEGEHLFEVSVYTGMWRGSGTSANVAMIVYGEETRSETLYLFDRYSDKRLFARASINNFIISLPDNLRSPIMIKIWHDNSGNNPSWYVSQVVIKDLESEEKWYFLCNRWVAVDKEDGELEVDIPLASKSDLSSIKYQFSTRVSKSLGDGHLWLSVVTRPPHSPFTRAQRLSCCVCVLLCAMLAGAMFYQFGEKQEDTVKFGPLRFSLKQLAIGAQSAVVVVPLNLLIVTIFRNIKIPYGSQQQSRYVQDEESGDNVANSQKNKKIKTPGCLPHFFVYIGWALCLLSSLAAGTFIIFYSVQWGKEISSQWLTSALVSFFQDIAVMQPIKVVAVALLLALILKKPPEEKTAQSAKNSTLDANKNVSVEAPKGDELVTARKTRESIVETVNTLMELIFFVVFVICLFLVVYGNRGYSRYRLTASLEYLLKDSFEEVDSKDSFWEWIEDEFIPGVYDATWYNDQPFIAPEGYISTREAFLVGMPRFKQVRVKEEYPCEVTEVYSEIESFFKRCIPPYSPDDEDDTRFNLPGWIPVTNLSKYHSVYDLLRLCPKPWRYNTSIELNTLSYYGRHAKYDGGGYVADLGYNSRTASRVVRSLESNDWIDERTAAVFVEFTVFDPSTSLFSVAKFLYEMIPTGKPETRARFDTLSIYGTSNPSLRSLFVACQIILLLLIAYFLLLETVKIYRQSCSYFRSFWNWMNLLQLIFAIITVAFFFFKEKYVSSFVEEIQANPFETASADYVLFWTDLELIVLSIVVFIVTVKFLRIIRFNRHVCQMVASLKLSSPHMISYSVVFFINILSFTLLGMLLFGNDVESYHSFINALGTLFQKFLGGDLHFYELQTSNRVLGPIYIFSYMLSMAFILINMFVAILNESYESVKELSGGKFADAELGDFIKEYYLARLTRLHEFFKRKLGNFGYRHQLYDRPKNESKLQLREEYVGSFMSLPSDYPPYVETWDRVDHSSQLALVDNEVTSDNRTQSEETIDTVQLSEETVEVAIDEPDIGSAPSVASSNDINAELLDLLGELPLIAPSIASSRNVSDAEFMNLLGDLPESMVDDDETIDNVRKGLADIGAVMRLSDNTLRRFSTTGDKYIVQANLRMGPSVALTLRPRQESEKHVIPV